MRTVRGGQVLALLLVLGALPALAAAQRPVIERVEPRSGPPGTEIAIVGRDLGADCTVLLGESPLEVLRRSANRWQLRVPEGAASGPIVVRTPHASFEGPTFRVTAAPPPPVVSSLTPRSGPPGTEVTLGGTGFSPRLADNLVTLGDRSVLVRQVTPVSLTVVVPEGAASGPFSVRVRYAGEARSADFAVEVPTAVASIAPALGPVGTEVTLTGTGFSANARQNRVYFGRRPGRVTSATSTTLVVQVPRGATSGPVLVDVRGAGRASSAPFTVQPPVQIRAVEPAAAPPGASVLLRGSGFGDDVRVVQVTVGGAEMRVRRVTPTEIEAEVVAGNATGPLAVRVHGLEGRARRPLRVTTPARIRAFTPRTGPVGAEVVVEGEGFGTDRRAVTVTLSGQAAEVVAVSGNELRFRVPEGAPSGLLEVAVRDAGSDRTSSPFVVTRPPSIASFSPESGTTNTEVTIVGQNFGQTPAGVRVAIGGQAMRVLSVSPERILAVVPLGARSGTLTVEVGLEGGARTERPFTVEALAVPPTPEPPAEGDDEGAPLAIEGVTPRCHRPNCEVVIRGTGFGASAAQNRVTFGGQPARVESASGTQLLVRFPNVSGTHRFVVEVRGVGRVESAPLTLAPLTR